MTSMTTRKNILACLTAACLVSAAFLPGIAAAQDAARDNSPQGLWLTENKRSVIEVKPCAKAPDELCGNIHWIIEGGMSHDSKNPDAKMRERPMCGLQILWGFEKLGESRWGNGQIYKADEGDTYQAAMEMNDDGTLHVRGYVGIPLLGKSQNWTRVSGDDYKECVPAK